MPTTIEERLLPASQLVASSAAHFSNESAEYRTARNTLFAEELELRRHLARAAAQRRALPPDGEIPRDFAFISMPRTAKTRGRITSGAAYWCNPC
jgi:predicted dithiol-disulfide oxidoreductase (DUF899 family)